MQTLEVIEHLMYLDLETGVRVPIDGKDVVGSLPGNWIKCPQGYTWRLVDDSGGVTPIGQYPVEDPRTANAVAEKVAKVIPNTFVKLFPVGGDLQF